MATKAHCCFVFETLEAKLKKQKSPLRLESFMQAASGVVADETSAPSPTTSHPLFVTYNTLKRDGEKRLRGCIGTFAARPLEDSLRQYAVVAALQDTRFSPIEEQELPRLEAAVSILMDFEEIEDKYDWEVGKHGLEVHFVYKNRGKSATFLPDVASEQGWSQDETLENLFRKGGWDGAGDWRDLDMDLERYQSTKASVTYDEYLQIRQRLSE